MAVAAMKHMALNFAKLDKFERVDFRRWQKKMHFLLSSKNVVYVLTNHIPKGGDGATMDQLRRRPSRRMMTMCVVVSFSMTDFKHTLKHKKEELTLVELGSHLRIEEPLRVQDNDKPEGNNVAGPSVVNMVEHNNSSSFTDKRGKRKHLDTKANPNKKSKVTCWECRKPRHLKKDCKAGKVGNKANGLGTKGLVDGSSNSLRGQSMFNKSLKIHYVAYVSETYYVQDDDVSWWIDSGVSVHACKDRCWFKTYEVLNDGSILHMRNESTTFVHRRGCVDLKFSSGKVVSLLNVLHVHNSKKNLGFGSILNNCGYKQVIESNKFVLSKHGKRNKVSDQHSYCFNDEDDPKIFDEEIKSHDVTFWKEAIHNEMDSIMGNNTWVLADPPSVQVDLTKEFLSSKFSIKDMGEADVILVSQLEYSWVIGCLMYAMTCTRPDIAFDVGKLSRDTINPSTQHWQAIQWVFMLGGSEISWASKKQTCITSLIMKSEFMALSAASKEAEWLKNLLHKIPLWIKPIAPISICCDGAATLAKAYSQMYNGKSRHLGIRHSMIRELIMNGVVSIEFVRSKHNLTDHLTNGLARDLVIKSAKGMGLKSNKVVEH
uniref:Zinc finger, CCHC-type n=1 Tax=Tanacetum cinerariifolium TaxID=118510 RepID=A0A6L2KXW3_TANCI|nr:zinc finger, CCHC-type [Tanacetum cinerariifolium]